MNDAGVTVEELVASLKGRRLRIPSDIGAFVALEACEALLRDGPAILHPSDVRIGEDGAITIVAASGVANDEDAARSVIALLASLLVAAGTGVAGPLVALVEGGAPVGPGALESLRDELEAALVPLNRSAARRVLSRMIREARRASFGAEPRLDDVPEDHLDDALDALLSGASAPTNAAPAHRGSPVTSAVPASRDRGTSEVDSLLADLSPPSAPSVPRPAPVPREMMLARTETLMAEPPREERPRDRAPSRPSRRDPSIEFEEQAPRRSAGLGLGWGLAFVGTAAIAVGGAALMRPDLVDRVLGRPPPPPVATQPEIDPAAAARAVRARYGSLTVTSEPAGAQVLLYLGRGPALANHLPTGMAYELVAIADGHAPTRAVVPANAQWEETPDGPRYELAMQTGEAPAEGTQLQLGDTRLPRDALGAPSATLGSIRVITSPPGAKVYLLVGFTPDVHVENVRTDEATELLVYREGSSLERVVLGPSDWTPTPEGGNSALVNVALRPTAPTRRGR